MSVVFSQNSAMVWLPITAFLIACAANGAAYLIGYAHGTKNSKIDAILSAQRAERDQLRGRRRRSRDEAPAPALARATFQPMRPIRDYGICETAVLQRVPTVPVNAEPRELVHAVAISEQRRGL
ncbi:hypothetical protein [Planosporangium mesophilum]|uniref:Uncharacterized protein n=1 Tax=Planosporangium mesophilum TaxID=689768 RepID=A0A8J3TRN0_9ACTN|nr:hypothetical protein [Planosporangium mesophilum]NJC83748.1 hypothetical protein [Planosporangium mesophilum]GII26070.1 hypothetical protein Pme01_56670 [Planosporangium mesophilum]